MKMNTKNKVPPFTLAQASKQISDFQINLRNWTIPFGRRFRAIRIWLMMKWFGSEGMISSSRQHVALAKQFESLVKNSEMFEVIYEVHWGLGTFNYYVSLCLDRAYIKFAFE